MPGPLIEGGGPEDPLASRHTLGVEVARLAEIGAILGEEDVGVGAVRGQLEGLARQLDTAAAARVHGTVRQVLRALHGRAGRRRDGVLDRHMTKRLAHSRRLHVDQVLVAQVTPGRRDVEVARRGGERPHALHGHALGIERGRMRLAVRLHRHPLHHRLQLVEAGVDGHRQLRITERAGNLLTERLVGDLDRRRPRPRKLEAQLEQRFEGERAVPLVRLGELRVGEARLQADPHAAPGPIRRAIGAVHPHGHAEDAALPGIRGAPGQSGEAGQHEGRNLSHGYLRYQWIC